MNKRGISVAIFTIIMITLVLFAAGILWGIIQNLISESAEDISLVGLTLDIGVQSAEIEGNNISVNVSNAFSCTITRLVVVQR